MAPRLELPFWIGAREFSGADLDLVCEVPRRFPRLSRWGLALTICANLGWERPTGGRGAIPA